MFSSNSVYLLSHNGFFFPHISITTTTAFLVPSFRCDIVDNYEYCQCFDLLHNVFLNISLIT